MRKGRAPMAKCVENSLKPLHRYAFPQSANDQPHTLLWFPGAAQFIRGKNVWNPELAVTLPEWELNVRRHNTDNRVSLSIQLDGFANPIRGATKGLLPETVADNDGVACLCPLVGQKSAAGKRADSQRRKEVRRHFRAPELHSLFVSLNFLLFRRLSEISQRFNQVHVRGKFLKQGRRNVPVKATHNVHFAHGDQPLIVTTGDRIQQHLVGNAEDRRVRPNAQRDRS